MNVHKTITRHPYDNELGQQQEQRAKLKALLIAMTENLKSRLILLVGCLSSVVNFLQCWPTSKNKY